MNTLISIIAIICFLVVVVDVWRSPASTVAKIVWSVLAFLFSVITLVVWLVWGRKNAYGKSGSLV